MTGAKRRNEGVRRTGRRGAGTLLLRAGPSPLFWSSALMCSSRRPESIVVTSRRFVYGSPSAPPLKADVELRRPQSENLSRVPDRARERRDALASEVTTGWDRVRGLERRLKV
jgi:hypothetical protein